MLWASYRCADKFLAPPERKQANVSVRMEWISFGILPYRKRNLMTARVSMSFKSRACLTCFRACFLPDRAKDLSAPRTRPLNKTQIIINKRLWWNTSVRICDIQGDQKVSVNLMITVQKSGAQKRFGHSAEISSVIIPSGWSCRSNIW
jgi:hypothetical protein